MPPEPWSSGRGDGGLDQVRAGFGAGVVADQNGGHVGLLASPVWLTVRLGGGQYAATYLPELDGPLGLAPPAGSAVAASGSGMVR
jgi:hypothetical protein